MPTYSRAYRAIHCLKAFLYRPQIDIYTFFSTLPTKQPRKIVTAFYRMTIFIGKVVSKLDLHLFRILPSFWKSALTTPTAPREQSGRHRSKKNLLKLGISIEDSLEMRTRHFEWSCSAFWWRYGWSKMRKRRTKRMVDVWKYEVKRWSLALGGIR